MLATAAVPLAAQQLAEAPKPAAEPASSAGGRRRGANPHAGQRRARPISPPDETLTFFGVKPGDTVVELWPGGGWYTEILAPYLASGGTLQVVPPAGKL